jgi:hypothetical protein
MKPKIPLLGAVLAVLPLACFVVLLATACYAAIALGHWPSYSNPDPKLLPLRGLYAAASVATIVGLVSLLGWPVFFMVKSVWLNRSEAHAGRAALMYAIGGALWMADLNRFVTGGLAKWIFD